MPDFDAVSLPLPLQTCWLMPFLFMPLRFLHFFFHFVTFDYDAFRRFAVDTAYLFRLISRHCRLLPLSPFFVIIGVVCYAFYHYVVFDACLMPHTAIDAMPTCRHFSLLTLLRLLITICHTLMPPLRFFSLFAMLIIAMLRAIIVTIRLLLLHADYCNATTFSLAADSFCFRRCHYAATTLYYTCCRFLLFGGFFAEFRLLFVFAAASCHAFHYVDY